MNKKNLKMRSVGSEYMEQYNALLRYVFQVTDEELSSIGWQEKEIIRAKFPTMEKADVIGWFDGDNLILCAVYPMQVRIFGQQIRNGGLTGVCTYPEYTNMGLMHKLLEQALKNMRKRGQYICYLYPYSIPYYRRKGWEIISDKISYEIKDYQLPKHQLRWSRVMCAGVKT
ncbi:MAG: enhanced intracellular survival protein Eis [Lachnospiraceae bacterium]